MSFTNSGPAVTVTPNYVSQAAPAASSSVPFDPSNVAITGGTAQFSNGSAAAPSISFASAPNIGMYLYSPGVMGFAVNGSVAALLNASGTFSPAGVIDFGAFGDTLLRRDAANTLAQRNGVNPQAFNLYNTYTDASNYEALQLNWNGNAASLTTIKAGTGVQRSLNLSGSALYFSEANVATRWSIPPGGNFLPAADNTLDVGSTGNRVRTVFAAQINAATKAGAFVAADIAAGTFMVGRDSVGATTKLYYNNGGVLQSVALA